MQSFPCPHRGLPHAQDQRQIGIRKTAQRAFLLASLLTGFSMTSAQAADWWTLSDAEFAAQYAKQATSDTLVDQSTVAWMLFARVNQPQSLSGKSFSTWELWPSNEDTFSPAVGLFKAENKHRTRPHLQPPKTEKMKGKLAAEFHGGVPDSAGEEVTRNMLSYGYITKSGLNTKPGVVNKLKSANPKVDLPIGAIEIKADWGLGATAGAYQVTDTTQSPPVTYSLLGIHIMAKMQPAPADPFTSEDPSWFWTTFEFQGNPGWANADSLLTYKDALPAADSTKLLTQAGLGNSLFKNYKCNGTQLRFSDAKNPNILLGNTQMEDFAFTPANATSPAQWTAWSISCHTCHATAAANPNQPNNLFYPFNGSPVGKLPAGQMNGYQSLDFIWSIPFFAR